ncbi:hypothetical protein SCRM01_270 [Synechococcus phage S-CRM01]|uniref:hypothetical protein n=1 Tax=Synechococcus phage S-CRM01 TaxID=1026955 RepID=UPI000209E30A|nr:hypothetical protein SCRM01_270 [Synechococcus phage S-CRM01]AEC53216.1 hypothetical protein SCRM01_270 [Synechococcus phage S-CRM01]
MKKPLIDVPGIKNPILRRLWILPLGSIMITMALILLVISFSADLIKSLAMIVFIELGETLKLAINMASDITTMVKNVWKGEQNG